MKHKNRVAERFDWTLTLLLLMFFLVSCVAIYSGQASNQYSGSNFLLQQVFWYGVGAVIVAVVMYFDSDQLNRLSWIIYGIGILLLVILAFAPVTEFTPKINGAQSWFITPVGSIQPSEFMKVFLIMALSRTICKHQEKFLNRSMKTDYILLLKIGFVTGLPILLVMMQPDLGTALVMLAIMTGIIFISGISWKIILSLYGSGAALAGIILYFVIWAPDILEKYLKVKPYQFDRIYAWLDPNNHAAGYHLSNSLKAIGSGMLTGKGFGERKVYIPESHTDFIFSVIGEEYGFLGGSIVIGLFFLLIYHLTKTALETVDPYNTYICVGIISMLVFHVFQNIGMTIQVLPITGIPLPFISYGGSSLMGNMFAMGLVYSIHYHHRNYMFSSGKNYTESNTTKTMERSHSTN
ncbi:FtsW/RodA/SpoVE family cell cycle protein [Bacillus tuaregi]|uniref:FtsW/RodA/SpoVE family cell cycle protein n=1 Tax=Bacillus tuaregi TaxID=1816695 RepID=UPI0008F94DE2|nr:FtsW/RodA/SpoVE family cell cycle protein [Bacillus tuaregi]